MKYAVVLAAGKGTRMKSSLNKVMHHVVDKPMIGHIISKLEALSIDDIEVVVGYQKEQIQEYLGERVSYAYQEELLGTGHAVMQVDSLKDKKGKTILLYGDVPLIQKETIEMMFHEVQDADMVVLSAQLPDPGTYGRIIRDNQGKIKKIVEYRDASEKEKRVKEINTGIYCFDNELLYKHLKDINNDNDQKEYYITDLVEIFVNNGLRVKTVRVKDIEEFMGINDRIQLADASKWLRHRINCQWMDQGVTFVDPENSYVSSEATIGEDTIIYPNVLIKGKSVIGKHTTIYPGSLIDNSTIGDYSTIESSKILDSTIENHVKVGPNAHIRNQSLIHDKVRIGNYVEIKNSTIGEDARCAHLTYIGDSDVGAKVNFGCGVVTVNYDGVNKHRTTIEEGAFIGSNVSLIAPIKIGKNAVVAAGSTVTQDVNEGDMVIERSQAVVKSGYGIKYKNKPKIEKGK